MKPSRASPAAMPNRFCSAMPHWRKRSGKAFLNSDRLGWRCSGRRPGRRSSGYSLPQLDQRIRRRRHASLVVVPLGLFSAIEGLLGRRLVPAGCSPPRAARSVGPARAASGRPSSGSGAWVCHLVVELGHLDALALDGVGDDHDWLAARQDPAGAGGSVASSSRYRGRRPPAPPSRRRATCRPAARCPSSRGQSPWPCTLL